MTTASSSAPARRSDEVAVVAALGSWTSGSGALHERLERALVRAVRSGDLPPGTRLPPERALAGALAVSRGTVVTAVAAAREAGWLTSRRGSGTWVHHDASRLTPVTTDPPGVAAASRRLSTRVLDRQPGVVDLAVSSVRDLGGVPESAFAITAGELLREGEGDGYQPFGSPGLRAALAARYTAAGLPTTVEQVLVTSGAQQALALAAAATLRRGDAAVVESPTYPGAIDVLARAGARLVPVPAAPVRSPGDQGASRSRAGAGGSAWIAGIREAVRSSGARVVYLMPACHNPLGTVMSEPRRRAVAALADELGVHVIADDLLELLTDVPQPRALASFSTTGRVITAGSLSKVVWGGLRVGWLRGPADLVAALGRTRAAADYGMSVVSQVIAGRLLTDLDGLAAARRRQFADRRALVTDALARHLPEWTVSPAQGGMSLWVRLPVGDSDALEQHAQRAGVAFTPGSAHSVDRSTTQHLRLSCTASEAELTEGVVRLARAWRSYLSAIDRQLDAERRLSARTGTGTSPTTAAGSCRSAG